MQLGGTPTFYAVNSNEYGEHHLGGVDGMWMFTKVMIAMSAVAGVATVPTVMLSHHSQSHTAVAVSLKAATDTHTSSAAIADGSSPSTSTNPTQSSTGTVTVYANGTNGQVANALSGNSRVRGSGTASGAFSGKGSSSATFNWSLPPLPVPPIPVDPVPNPPSKPVQPPSPPPIQPPVKSGTQGSTTVWGKISAVGGGRITVSVKGQSGASTFTMDGTTEIDFVGGPIRALDDTSTASMSRLRAGDNVMLVAKDNHATLIVDRGGITGPYLPLGGGSVQGGASGGAQSSGTMQVGGTQSGATTQTSGAMQAGGFQ